MNNKKMLVVWGGTSPEKLGYDIHVNLRNKVCSTPECHRPNSYMFDIQSNGMMWDCPYSDKCMKYKSELILNSFRELTKDIPKTEKNKDKIQNKCDNCH